MRIQSRPASVITLRATTPATRTAATRPPCVRSCRKRRCFSLGERDLELVWDRVGPGARLVGGLQIGALRLLGFVPDDVMSAPSRVVEFVGSQVRATAG